MNAPVWTPFLDKQQCMDVLQRFDRDGDIARATLLTQAISRRRSTWESIRIAFLDGGIVVCTIPRRHGEFVLSFEVDTRTGLACFVAHVLSVHDALRAS